MANNTAKMKIGRMVDLLFRARITNRGSTNGRPQGTRVYLLNTLLVEGGIDSQNAGSGSIASFLSIFAERQFHTDLFILAQ